MCYSSFCLKTSADIYVESLALAREEFHHQDCIFQCRDPKDCIIAHETKIPSIQSNFQKNQTPKQKWRQKQGMQHLRPGLVSVNIVLCYTGFTLLLKVTRAVSRALNVSGAYVSCD